MTETAVFIAIGSNLGDKHQNCLDGISRLREVPGVSVTDVSPFYRTAPVDYTDQDWFVNAALRIVTELAPESLLKVLKTIEKELGREEGGIRFGPRPLDMDIIFYGDHSFHSELLEIPHPRMHKRRFVLQPICDIEPATIHPVFKQTVRRLLDQIDDPEQQIYPLS